MGLLLRIKKPLLTGATQRAHRRTQPLPSGLSPSAPESNRFGRARALFAGLSAHGPHHRRCGITPPPEAAYSIPTSCQNSNMQNPASIKGAAASATTGPLPPHPPRRCVGRPWPGKRPGCRPAPDPAGPKWAPRPQGGGDCGPTVIVGGECPGEYAARPFPPSAPAGRRVPFCRPIAAPSRAAFLRRGSAHRRPFLSRGPVPAKTKPDAFPQVAGEAPGVSCIGLLRRAAAFGGD